MERVLEYAAAGEWSSVGGFLKTKGYSRHVLTVIKRDGKILRNGSPCYTNERLLPGDRVTVRLPLFEASKKILPVKLPLKIVYEDEDLFVIDKGADMPVHPSFGNHENTLANGLAWYCQERAIPFVFYCINRLDRDTTGLLICAKNLISASVLSDALQKRQIHREYLALASGLVPKEGIIDAPIGRLPGSALARCVDWENGEPAVTHYRRLAYQGPAPALRANTVPEANEFPDKNEDGCSLVSICLETGRTHQIRVHMKYLGHPLPGDFLYNPDFRRIRRQALHSHRLEFPHPVTGESLSFSSPLPEDMQRAFQTRTM